MEKKNIVVTGANGYIGHNVVKHLLDNGFNVTAVDMNNNNIDERANFININLFKKMWFLELLGHHQFVYTWLGEMDLNTILKIILKIYIIITTFK